MRFDVSKRETACLWAAIALLVSMTLYRLYAASVGLLLRGDPNAALPIAAWVYNAVSLVTVLLLWISYRRWVETINRRRELEAVMKSIGPDMLMVVNPAREITMCNDGVEAVFGYTAREVIGRRTDFLYFDRRVTGQKREVHDRLATIGFHTGFAKGRRKDGRVIPLEIVTGDLPNQPGAVMLIRDITERKQAEDQLIEAKERAEAATAELRELENLRDNLTHMIVHDLKSPLTALSGYIDLLRRYSSENLSDRQRGFLDEAGSLTRRLAEMINSLLDMRRLEDSEMPLNRVVCDLREVTEAALGILGPACAHVTVTVACPHGPPLAFCDADIVRRVIMNLVSNAVKFSPRNGTVTVSIEREADAARVSVTDNGPGIPRQYHEKIFQRFGQLEAREFSTGLGLTFCRLAVEAHGGRIGLESELGKGSTFWIRLPLTPGPQAAPPAAGASAEDAPQAPGGDGTEGGS